MSTCLVLCSTFRYIVRRFAKNSSIHHLQEIRGDNLFKPVPLDQADFTILGVSDFQGLEGIELIRTIFYDASVNFSHDDNVDQNAGHLMYSMVILLGFVKQGKTVVYKRIEIPENTDVMQNIVAVARRNVVVTNGVSKNEVTLFNTLALNGSLYSNNVMMPSSAHFLDDHGMSRTMTKSGIISFGSMNHYYYKFILALSNPLFDRYLQTDLDGLVQFRVPGIYGRNATILDRPKAFFRVQTDVVLPAPGPEPVRPSNPNRHALAESRYENRLFQLIAEEDFAVQSMSLCWNVEALVDLGVPARILDLLKSTICFKRSFSVGNPLFNTYYNMYKKEVTNVLSNMGIAIVPRGSSGNLHSSVETARHSITLPVLSVPRIVPQAEEAAAAASAAESVRSHKRKAAQDSEESQKKRQRQLVQFESIVESPASSNAPLTDELKRTLDSFQCVICLEPVIEATAIKCGHVFCNNCIRRHMSSSQNKGSCPTCREKHVGSTIPMCMIDNSVADFIKRYWTVEQKKERLALMKDRAN